MSWLPQGFSSFPGSIRGPRRDGSREGMGVRRRRTLAGLVVALTALTLVPSALAVTIEDLGTLGGPFSAAVVNNNLGQVAGLSNLTAGGRQHAFLWTPGATDGVPTNPQMKDLGTPAGTTLRSLQVKALNDLSQVVGSFSTTTPSFGKHAFLWKDDVMTDLGTLGADFDPASGAADVNNLGQVVGRADTASGETRAVLWEQPAGITDLGTLGGTFSEALKINDLSQVTGSSFTAAGELHAFLLTPKDLDGDGTPDVWNRDADGDGANDLMVDLGTFGGTTSSASALNDIGQVVGDADTTAAGGPHAFVSRDAPVSPPVLVTTENQITTTSDVFETTPTVGEDATSKLVVYTSQALLLVGLDQGEIFYQRLTDTGAPTGDPLLVSDSLTDDRLNDVSGARIVFTAFETTSSSIGTIKLFDTTTSAVTSLSAEAVQVFEARIHGDSVVWVEGATDSTFIKFLDLGSAEPAKTIAGPVPATTNVEIGERYVVWDEGPASDGDIVAFVWLNGDLDNPTRISVASTPGVDERQPSTSGDWIAWQADGTSIHAANLRTGETRVVAADDGSFAQLPTVDGDIVAYESNSAGNFDVYVYRISDGSTFQLTDDPDDQFLNNVHGDLVAYADNRNGDVNVFVSAFTFTTSEIQDLGTLGGATSNAADINNLAQVAGKSLTASGETHGFLAELDSMGAYVMTDLGTLGGSRSDARALNNLRQVTGISKTTAGEDHGYLWEEGVMTDLGTLGGTFSASIRINDLGEMVGGSTTALGETHATLWRTSAPAELVGLLVDLVDELVATGRLDEKKSNGIRSKLFTATELLDMGQICAATQVLEAFINQVEGLVNANKLSEADGQLLIDAARDVISDLTLELTAPCGGP